MEEYNEGIFAVAVYLFVATAFSLPFVVGYLFYRVIKVVKRATNLINYIYEGESETRKYHE